MSTQNDQQKPGKLKDFFKAAKSAEELQKIAKENGIDMSESDAAQFFSSLNTMGEMDDDELSNVSGGACGKPAPKFQYGDLFSPRDDYDHRNYYMILKAERYTKDKGWVYTVDHYCPATLPYVSIYEYELERDYRPCGSGVPH